MEVSVGSWPAANPVNLDRLANEEVTAGEGTGGSGVSSSATKAIFIGVFFQKIRSYLLEVLFLLSLGEDSLEVGAAAIVAFFFLSLLWPAFFPAFVSSFPRVSPVSQSARPAVFWMCSFNDFSKGWEGATKLGLTAWRWSESWNKRISHILKLRSKNIVVVARKALKSILWPHLAYKLWVEFT